MRLKLWGRHVSAGAGRKGWIVLRPFSWPRVMLVACFHAVLLFVVLMLPALQADGRLVPGAGDGWVWGQEAGPHPDPTPLPSLRCLPLRLSFLSFIAWCSAFSLGLDCAQGVIPGRCGDEAAPHAGMLCEPILGASLPQLH